MRTLRSGLSLVLGFVVVSCGGGGGGGGSSDSGGIAFDYSGVPVDLQTADPVLVAATVLAVEGEVSLLTDSLPDVIASAAASPTYLWTPGFNAYRQQLLASSPLSVVQPAVVIGPENEPCTYGGSLTISANLADPQLFVEGILQVGDDFFTDSLNCEDEPGIVFNGGMDFTVTAFSGDIDDPEYDVGLDFDFDLFRYTEAGESALFDGSAEVVITTLSNPDVGAASGDLLLCECDGITYSLQDFAFVDTQDGLAYTQTASGILETDVVTGELDYSVLVPFSGSLPALPDAGQLEILGANQGRMLVTAFPGELLQIQVDADGDDVFENVIDTDWDALDAALEAAAG